MKSGLKILPILCFMLLCSCGEKSGPVLNFKLEPSTWANDPRVTYLAFRVVNVANSDGQYLDSNNDGQPDVFGFPQKCISPQAPGGMIAKCGYSPNQASFDLSGIPLNFSYIIDADIKDATGAEIYDGQSAAFINTQNSTLITINLVSQ